MSNRKRYRPRGASPDAWIIAMQGSCLLSQADQELRSKPVFDAVEMISKGNGTRDCWSVIFDALNMTEEFSRMPKVMQGATDYIESMQGVVVGIIDRQREAKARALYPSELKDLREFADLWEELLSTVTHREFFVAETNVNNRLRSIVASKTPGVRVVEAA